jgi:hypothetical protein
MTEEQDLQTPVEQPQAKSGCSTGLKVVGIGCGTIILLILIVIGVLYWKGRDIAASIASKGVTHMIDQSGLPDEQKARLQDLAGGLIEEFKNNELTTEELAGIMMSFGESNLFPLMFIDAMGDGYINKSGLSEEEKEAGRLSVDRFVRGVAEEKIESRDTGEVLGVVIEQVGENQYRAKDSLTDKEVRSLIEKMNACSDSANIPQEPYVLDVAAEFEKVVQKGKAKAASGDIEVR